jgi:adenylate kinase family enzyme
MVNYQNGKIYKITSYQTDAVYYGSTCNTLAKRFQSHKDAFKYKKYPPMSKQILCYEECMITLVEKYPCNDKSELTARERYYIENNECVNKQLPGRTVAEWREDNKKILSEKSRKYQATNAEKIKIYQSEYRKIHNEKNKEYYKKYYENNRHKKTNCCCGSVYSYLSKARHEKTKKHQNFIK